MAESKEIKFASLGAPRRTWAVAAIHAELQRLTALHDAIFERIRPGDRLVYLGNYAGYGHAAVETIDEILAFRRMVMALPHMMADDIVYLRGAQEEMWQKLLQVTFATHPASVMQWVFERGVAPTLESYGFSPEEGLRAAAEGVIVLTRWLNKLRDATRSLPGHDIFTMQWRRAAFTEDKTPLLLVHAGIDPNLPLDEQGDSFWWAGRQFSGIETRYEPFIKVIRGYDPAHDGLALGEITATIDGGCGFGGNLIAACIGPDGNILEILEA